MNLILTRVSKILTTLAISNKDASNSEEFGGPSANTSKQLSAQLTQWRGMLPQDLQWDDDDPAAFPSPQTGNVGGYNQPVDPSLSASRQSRPNTQLFSTDLNSEPMQYRFVYDVQVAILRTRYYYAKYMVYRPFVYKALHFPDQMTQEDAQGVAECLRVSLHELLSRSSRLIRLGMSQMATDNVSHLTAQKTCSIPFLLVPNIPLYPAHILLDTTQSHATRYSGTTLWPAI